MTDNCVIIENMSPWGTESCTLGMLDLAIFCVLSPMNNHCVLKNLYTPACNPLCVEKEAQTSVNQWKRRLRAQTLGWHLGVPLPAQHAGVSRSMCLILNIEKSSGLNLRG